MCAYSFLTSKNWYTLLVLETLCTIIHNVFVFRGAPTQTSFVFSYNSLRSGSSVSQIKWLWLLLCSLGCLLHLMVMWLYSFDQTCHTNYFAAVPLVCNGFQSLITYQIFVSTLFWKEFTRCIISYIDITLNVVKVKFKVISTIALKFDTVCMVNNWNLGHSKYKQVVGLLQFFYVMQTFLLKYVPV